MMQTPHEAPRIVVVGSMVLDLTVRVPHFPRRGETMFCSGFDMFAGGKGFNQAVTARRCGASVVMVGTVGNDPFGDLFLQILERETIDARFVSRQTSIGTSLGIPLIDPSGENSIIGIPQANTRLSPADVEPARAEIGAGQVLLLQLEVPLEASLHGAEIARLAGAIVILNPAPAHLPLASLLRPGLDGRPLIDWLTPNEIEVEMLAGMPAGGIDEAFSRSREAGEAAVWQAGRTLLAGGLRRGVIVTLGARGAMIVTAERQERVPGFRVTPVDPTGAGDAFCGAFAVALAEGRPPAEAVRFANAAGAVSVTRPGAEPSLPRRDEVEAVLAAGTGA